MKVRASIIAAGAAVGCWRLVAGAVALSTGAALALGVAPGADAQINLAASLRSGGGGASLYGASCTAAHACEAVGYYFSSTGDVTLAEAWNGTKWAMQTAPNPSGSTGNFLNGVSCTATGTCEAVGYYTNSSGDRKTLAEVWNGTRWAMQTTPNPSGSTGSVLNGVSCTATTACEATGYYNSGALAEVWNGTKWAIQTTPGPSSSLLDGVSCTSAAACEAVGNYTSSSGIVTLAEVWNGTKWAMQTTPNPSGSTGSGSALHELACTAAGACEAVGDYQKSTRFLTLAEVWNGTKWAIQTTPNPSSSTGSFLLYGVSCISTAACEAVGSANSGAVPTLAEVWNGTKWAIQATPTP